MFSSTDLRGTSERNYSWVILIPNKKKYPSRRHLALSWFLFNNKQFIRRIELGKQEPKEFVDEMLETVISDLNQPFKVENSFESKEDCAIYL